MSRNPATEVVLGRVPLSGAGDVAAAARAARSAFHDWSEIPVPERVKYLYTLRTAYLDNREELIRGVTIENGKIYSDAAGEYRRALEVIEFAIGMPTLMAGYNVESVSRGIDTMMERYPVGVTAAITPFNFPLMVPFWTLPIAIAAGNTYILKPSERTPYSAMRIAELIDQIGLPAGVFNLVHGAADAVQAICAEPEIDAVSFVGSARVARIVYEACGKHGKRVQALGGAKNHIVVMPDAVVAPSVENLAKSAFGNAGQRCLAGSVLTVVGSASETVLPHVVEKAESMKLGFGLDEGIDMGPVIRADSRERIRRLVDQGLSEGATIIRDGRSKVPDKGFFVGPTMIEIQPEFDPRQRGAVRAGPVGDQGRHDRRGDRPDREHQRLRQRELDLHVVRQGRPRVQAAQPGRHDRDQRRRRRACRLLPVQRPSQLVLRRPARHGSRRRRVLHDQEDDDHALVLIRRSTFPGRPRDPRSPRFDWPPSPRRDITDRRRTPRAQRLRPGSSDNGCQGGTPG